MSKKITSKRRTQFTNCSVESSWQPDQKRRVFIDGLLVATITKPTNGHSFIVSTPDGEVLYRCTYLYQAVTFASGVTA